MDHARSYNNGIDVEVVKELSFDKLLEGSTEANHVRGFSIMSMKYYHDSGDRIYFAPIINAICMPLPRAFFPWKPNAEYYRKIQMQTIRDSESGSAYMNIAENYIAFGWLGIIVNGLFIGYLAKIFWNNYRKNLASLGAIVLLGVFNGVCYVLISRGYLAQGFGCFLYFVCLPFWLLSLFKKIIPKLFV